MKFISRSISLFMVASLCKLLVACKQEETAAKKTLQPVEVVTQTVQPADTPVSFQFVGKTASSRKVEIRSRVAGFLEKRLYQEGEFVQEGEVLFQMDRKPFEVNLDAAEAELAQQQAKLQTAKANLDRVRPLVKKNAVAQKELDDALGSYRSSIAAVEAAKANVKQANLDLSYTEIRSPVYGLSSFAVQQEGAYIGIGTEALLTYVAQIDPIWVEFSISENQLLKHRRSKKDGFIKLPEDSHYTVEIILADGSVYPHRGKITFLDASINEKTGTFLLRAEVDNPDVELRPGQFVRANLIGAIRPDAILIPKTAVQQGAKGSFVWVVSKDKTAELRPVTVGAWKDNQWFINEGLNKGDTIVVQGGIKLRAGTPLVAASQTGQKFQKTGQ
jgi:membrane fusion protein (multidrug efflux system)